MTRPHRAQSLLGAIALVIVGFGTTTVSITRAASPTIEISDAAIAPADVSVLAGDVVTWRNTSTTVHEIAADDGSYDSGPLSLNDQFAHLFDIAGTFRYHDPQHPELAGVVRVSAAPPTATPNGTPRPTPPGGTLPPDFKTPVPVPTALSGSPTAEASLRASPTSSAAALPGSVAPASPSPSAGGNTGSQGGGPIVIAFLVIVGLVIAVAVVWRRRTA